MSVQEFEAEALKLRRHERARLAEVLIASLDAEDELTRAWSDEAERRHEELRTGAVEAVPADEVFARIRSRLVLRRMAAGCVHWPKTPMPATSRKVLPSTRHSLIR